MILLFLVLFPILAGHAQETIFANDSHVVTVFFPSPIRQAVTGAEHFTFSYNRESGQHFGLLQANKGNDSNLLVITQDGWAYTYGLEYRRQLPETYRFVSVQESIGTETETFVLEKRMDTLPIQKPIEIPKIDPAIEMWEKGAEYVLARKTKSLKTKRKGGMVLRLRELFYHKDEVYVEVEVLNRSAIDFEVDVLEIYKVNGKRGRRSSHQKVILEPKFKYGFPEIVRVGQPHSFVYVLPKFTLGDTASLLMELLEKNGNGMLRLRWD